MDNSHCREIHYHLARALMHLNSMRVFSQFLNLQWTGMIIEVDPYTAIPASPVHTRDNSIRLYLFLLLRQFRRYIITWKYSDPHGPQSGATPTALVYPSRSMSH